MDEAMVLLLDISDIGAGKYSATIGANRESADGGVIEHHRQTFTT
jgi:hypothetical protein